MDWLVAAMRRAGYLLLDCQFMTDHLATMGAVTLPQVAYLEKLLAAFGAPSSTIPFEIAAANAHSSPGNSIAQDLTHTS